jgi:hypothetical protein
VIDGEYAARVRDLNTYKAVSRDIINRWVHPLVPDNNFLGISTYRHHRGAVYQEQGTSIHRYAQHACLTRGCLPLSLFLFLKLSAGVYTSDFFFFFFFFSFLSSSLSLSLSLSLSIQSLSYSLSLSHSISLLLLLSLSLSVLCL